MYPTFCVHTSSEAEERIASIVREFTKAGRQMNRYSYDVSAQCFFPCVQCVWVFADALGHQNCSIRGCIFVCIYEWECMCVWVHSFWLQTVVFRLLTDTCVRTYYHCWETGRSRGGKVRRCLLSQNHTTLSGCQRCRKTIDMTTIKAIRRKEKPKFHSGEEKNQCGRTYGKRNNQTQNRFG